MRKRYLAFFRNKFVVATTIFLLWVCFFNDINLFYIIKSKMELNALKKEAVELEKKNKLAKTNLEDLSNNTASLEKFAREAYYMKKENEDVFVFKERSK